MFTGIVILLVSFQSIYLTNAAQVKLKNNDRIHFPGPIKETPIGSRYGSDRDSDVPEKCRGKNYCTVKPADYPEEKFNKMFKDVRPIQQASLILSSNIDDRQGDPEEVDNCETLVEYDNLYKVKSRTGEWRVVVQAPEKNFVQKVRLETCQSENGQCFNIYLGLPGYTTYCKQQYTQWQFTVEANDGSDKTEKITVDLPTCCSCHYKELK